jgi:hypothetical protein
MAEETRKPCVYCGKSRRLTSKHIFPVYLIERRNQEYLASNSKYFERGEKFIEGKYTIEDVCTNCNKGTLSVLDEYINNLYDRVFSSFLNEKQVIEFTYDYNLLLRWLIKVSFDSARANNRPEAKLLARFTGYILEKGILPENVYLYLLPVTSSNLARNQSLKRDDKDRQLGEIPPALLRITFIENILQNKHRLVIRIVAINSYYFLFLYLPNKLFSAKDQQKFQEKFNKDAPQWFLLQPNETRAYLPPPTVDILSTMELSANLSKFFYLIFPPLSTQKFTRSLGVRK